MDGKEESTEQGVPCLKTKGGLCDAGQLRLFIIIAPFFFLPHLIDSDIDAEK